MSKAAWLCSFVFLQQPLYFMVNSRAAAAHTFKTGIDGKVNVGLLNFQWFYMH